MKTKIARSNWIAIVLAVAMLFVVDFAKTYSTFEPLTPKNPAALHDAAVSAKAEYDSISARMSAATERVDTGLYTDDFQAANALYKAGRYAEAKAAYERILSACPVHLGARNNYVLTLVHLEDYENALKNSILLGLIHPGYDGNRVNILIPLYALGYDSTASSEGLSEAGVPGVSSGGYMDLSAVSDAYMYNLVYTDMEAAIGKEELQDKLTEYENILQALRDKEPGDTDCSELLTYFEGLQKIRTR